MKRNVVIGLIALAIFVAIIYWYQKNKKASELLPAAQPTYEQSFEDKFNIQIPEDVDKAELKDVSGGNGSGLATKQYENGRFTHNVLADLPDPAAGYFYEGWLVNGNEGDLSPVYVKTGKMSLVKGGYLLEFESSKDYSGYAGVVISLEKVFGSKPDKPILEGSF